MSFFKRKEKNKKVRSRNARNRSNSSILHITYAVTAVFVCLIAYFSYFVFAGSQNIIGSTYNPRLDSFSERVTRGKIKTSDGVVLAYTETDESGGETRIYPHGELFSHLTGYSSKGKTGIESLGNFYLLSSHINLLEQIENEITGRKSPGDDIWLTADYDLQKIAYDALGERNGAVMAMEPQTGRVLCMVSKPTFDPNTINEDWESLNAEGSDNGQLLNRATQGQYPPGSTFKILTALEYIHENPESCESFSYNCTGAYTDAEGNTIKCYNSSAHGEQSLYEAFANSCNGAFAKLGTEIDVNKMKSLAEKMFFNAKLPIELPYSRSRYTLEEGDPDFLKELTAIGQGNTMTSPAHLLLLTSAIANDGVLMKPMFMDHLENAGGEDFKHFEGEEYGRLLNEKDARILKEMMRLAVTEGTGSAFRDAGYEACAKTGSAEYDNGNKTHAWCLAFAPLESPSIAVAVVVEDGKTGGATAAPVARAVIDEYLSEQGSR